MQKKVVIFGTGDFARIAEVYLTADSPYEVVAFTVHRERLETTQLRQKPVVAFEELEQKYPPDEYSMFVAIGFGRVNKSRAEIYDVCKSRGYELITYVNSKAVSWGEIEIGDNCFIFENNVIQPFARIGNNVILWSGNHIGHDATIEDHCFISSHVVVSGNVTVGNHSFLGVNATIRDGVTIGPESVIGAAAVILKDTPPQAVYRTTETLISKVTSDRLRHL